MSKSITIHEASVLWVKNLKDKSAFFAQELSFFLYQTRKTKQFDSHQIIKFRKDAKLQRVFGEVIAYLEERNLIETTTYDYYLIKGQDSTPLEIIGSLYPLGYFSHLTAMQIYNLTDRFPKAIDFTAPIRATWKKHQKDYFVESEFDDTAFEHTDFSLPYPSEVISFNGKKLQVHSRKVLLPFIQRGKHIRVIEIGCLFLEMLRYPDSCGGFQHVFDIFEEMGEALSEEILSAVEKFGNNIDKSRVGYLFEKHLRLEDNRISSWKLSAVARGGSRKMLAYEPYSSVYDEDWCISLNHVIFAGN